MGINPSNPFAPPVSGFNGMINVVVGNHWDDRQCLHELQDYCAFWQTSTRYLTPNHRMAKNTAFAEKLLQFRIGYPEMLNPDRGIRQNSVAPFGHAV
ncbi:MAG: hypothetical protein ABI824_04140 [Acidobacteriota bacterium]